MLSHMRVALDCSLAPERVFLALRREPWPFALTGRWAGGGAIVGCSPRALLRDDDDPFERLEDLPPRRGDAEVGGGWFGWLGYGLGARVEALPPRPPRPVPLPEAHLAFYDHVLRQDAGGRWWFESLGDGAEHFERLRGLLAAAPEPVAPAPATFSVRAGGHLAAVRDCVERIAAGEIFQANLCLRLDAAWAGDVAELFAHAAPRLKPAYGACFVTPWGGIASLSPELFLRRRGPIVTTGPIKGTSPRDGDPAALRRSAKDRAEHVMIVDLMRNDLGRVAQYGSVEAAAAPEAQPHPGVWHLVSEVRARLAPGNGDAALLRATFPPGSVTGAPKVQALHVISELEATGREVYTGAIGYASPHAGLELSVAIRTFEARAGRLWLGAGGGIVADSDPHAELEECLVKARPLITAIGAKLKGPGPLANLKGPGPFRFALARERRRPDAALGVFTTLRVRDGEPVALDAHLRRLSRSVAALYGERLPDVEIPRHDGAVRIVFVPGAGVRVETRPLTTRAHPIVLTPYVLPGGLGEHKWSDRRLVDALSADGTTPLLVDADGTVLEAAWASVLVRRDGRLLTPRVDGRILPSTSRPDAEEADIRLREGDEVFLSSATSGVVPATIRGPSAGTPRTPARTGA
jgi:para-aminobenzoate synthetase/4-amino-4-deoxychorismate lyase